MFSIKANKIAGGGVCTSLCLILLFAASYIPNVKLAFMFASSIVVGICILRYRLFTTAAVYVAVSVLAVFVIPNKFVGLGFAALFGIYPIVKLYIEKIKSIPIEYIIKIIVWNIILLALYIILKALGQSAFWDFGLTILWICGLILLFVYDIAFGVVISAFYKSYYKYLK